MGKSAFYISLFGGTAGS